MVTEAGQALVEEHPGVELGRQLEDRGLTDASVADKCGLSRPLMSQITNGNRRITVNSATRICRIIGGDPMYWVKRQQEHDLWLKGQQVKHSPEGTSRGQSVGR